MIDWHSHILPAMDDGSQNVTESISLLNMLASQGVTTVIATPHFYANDETIDTFLKRRTESFAQLEAAGNDSTPKVLLGAEVKYYQGISRMNDIEALRIEDTKMLLLEMPVSIWSDYMVRELLELSSKRSLQIVLAHVERYLPIQKHGVWEELLDSGLLMQVNASYFTSFASKRKALSRLKDGMIHLIGSDCHNLTVRPPKIGKAFEVIQKKLGEEFLDQLTAYGYSLLTENNFQTL